MSWKQHTPNLNFLRLSILDLYDLYLVILTLDLRHIAVNDGNIFHSSVRVHIVSELWETLWPSPLTISLCMVSCAYYMELINQVWTSYDLPFLSYNLGWHTEVDGSMLILWPLTFYFLAVQLFCMWYFVEQHYFHIWRSLGCVFHAVPGDFDLWTLDP